LGTADPKEEEEKDFA